MMLRSVFCLACLCLVGTGQTEHSQELPKVHQEQSFISAIVGDNLTLLCFYDGDSSTLFWYKQTLGQKPQLLSSIYNFGNSKFHAEYENDSRFSLENSKGVNNLKIFRVQTSDTGTYFCARRISYVFEFGKGTTVSVASLRLTVKASVHQPESESTWPEASTTLNCTIQTGTCDEELGVYWFKNSEEMLYTHGGKNSQCEMESSTQTRKCVHTLPMKDLDQTHTGKYYCAVASCGHIFFGNGTTLDTQGNSRFVVYFLIGALTVTIIISVVLAFLIFKMIKGRSRQLTESGEPAPNPSMANPEVSDFTVFNCSEWKKLMKMM